MRKLLQKTTTHQNTENRWSWGTQVQLVYLWHKSYTLGSGNIDKEGAEMLLRTKRPGQLL